MRHRCSAPLSALGALRAPLRCLRTAQHAPLLCLRAARSAARSALRARAFRAEGADAFAAFAAAAAVAAPAAAERALTSAAAAAAEAWAGVPTAAASVAIAAAASPCASFSSFSFCLRLRARRCCVVSASLPGLFFFAAVLLYALRVAHPERWHGAITPRLSPFLMRYHLRNGTKDRCRLLKVTLCVSVASKWTDDGCLVPCRTNNNVCLTQFSGTNSARCALCCV